jgi:intracellular septation protein
MERLSGTNNMRQHLKSILEFIPLITFLGLFKTYNIIVATSGLIITSLIAMILLYIIYKEVSKMTIFSNIILIVFGSITLLSGDSKYIKMKPTFLYLLFSAILTYDIIKQKGWLKHVLGAALELKHESYILMSKQWLLFCLAMAALNEFMWRNFSESAWVNFKVFGILGLTFTFTIAQLLYFGNEIKEKVDK